MENATNESAANGVASAAALLIGDELLAGRTRDANLTAIAQALSDGGVELCEARVVADDREAIIEALDQLRERYDFVLTTGGIGPTHDDITAECVAEAFGSELEVHAESLATMRALYAERGLEMTPAREKMAKIPRGATPIRNVVSAAPGFRIENVFVLAGVPVIARAMLEEIARALPQGAAIVSRALRTSLGEGDIAAAVGAVHERFAPRGARVGSYPWHDSGRYGVRLVARGRDAGAVDGAIEALRSALRELGDPHAADEADARP